MEPSSLPDRGYYIDECSDGSHDCAIYATCNDLFDGFECICHPGSQDRVCIVEYVRSDT